MKRFWSAALVAAVGLACAGCATRADKVSAAYVSPLQYDSYDCAQLGEEALRVSGRAAEVTGAQNKKATNDAVATGVAIIVFWPALFFIDGDDEKTAELARLKGEVDAIQQVSIKKGCGIEVQSS